MPVQWPRSSLNYMLPSRGDKIDEYIREIKGILDRIGSQASLLEDENKTLQLKESESQSAEKTLRDRIDRHLRKYRNSYEDARENGDDLAAAAHDQRIKALEALLKD